MDQKELESWLNTRPREDAILIAQRAALRVFPVWGELIQNDRQWARGKTNLVVMRCLLVSGVARKFPAIDFMGAASSAVAAADFTGGFPLAALSAFSATSAVATLWTPDHELRFCAANAVTFACSAASSHAEVIWNLIGQDVTILQSGADLPSTPLWHSDTPETILQAEETGLENLTLETGDRNSFWHRWYHAAKRGEWLDWDLQRDIALIPDPVWKEGPKAVLAAIAEIELAHAIAKTPIAEEVLRDDAGLFYTLPLSTIRPDLFRDAMEKVRDTMAELRANQRLANCLTWLADDLHRLEDHFIRYANHPLRIHDVFQKTLRHLDRLQAEGLLPDDGLLEDFRQDLETGSIDIRRADPEVAKTVKARVGDRLARLSPQGRADLAPVVQAAAKESRPDLKAELQEDHATATDPGAEAQDRDESGYRLSGRLLRMAKRRKDDGVKAADDIGKVVKGAESVDKVIDAAPGWWDWIMTNLPQWFG